MRAHVRAAGLVVAAVLTAAAGFPAWGQELYAYVGAGLRPPVDALIEAYRQKTGVVVKTEYGGSGQLLTRIEETGKGDLFIPGTTFYTDKLKEKGGVRAETILVLHGPVLAVANGKADQIQTFADLAKPGVRLGLGDPAAMALGRTADEILDHSGQGDVIRRNVTVRAATVKQLALYVVDGNVDAAIIGASEAAQMPGKFVVRPIPADWFQAEYAPVAVLSISAQPDAAAAFAAFLASDEGLATFARFGFPPARR